MCDWIVKASIRGQKRMVKAILDLDFRDKNEYAALAEASARGHFKVVKLIMESGVIEDMAFVATHQSNIRRALIDASAAQRRHTRIMEYLIALGADLVGPDYNELPVIKTICNNCEAGLQILLDAGTPLLNHQMMLLAVERKNVTLVRAAVEARTYINRPTFVAGLQSDSSEITNLIFSNKSTEAHYLGDVIIDALRKNHARAYKFVLKYFPEIDTGFFIRAARKSPEVIETMLATGVEVSDEILLHSLHIFPQPNLRRLIRSGLYHHMVTDDDSRAIDEAVTNQLKSVIPVLLIDTNAFVLAKNAISRALVNVIKMMETEDSFDMVEIMLELALSGANVHYNDCEAFITACEIGAVLPVEMFIKLAVSIDGRNGVVLDLLKSGGPAKQTILMRLLSLGLQFGRVKPVPGEGMDPWFRDILVDAGFEVV
ncbi:hypothetical protein HDU76_010956 [Blyttiomyces sp. JEL0837]|nr:hypothetical protein HDU76_010956 [Blyttiomyces sp. JEL0837]